MVQTAMVCPVLEVYTKVVVKNFLVGSMCFVHLLLVSAGMSVDILPLAYSTECRSGPACLF